MKFGNYLLMISLFFGQCQAMVPSLEQQFQTFINELSFIGNNIKEEHQNNTLTKGTYATQKNAFDQELNAMAQFADAHPTLKTQVNYQWFKSMHQLKSEIEALEPN